MKKLLVTLISLLITVGVGAQVVNPVTTGNSPMLIGTATANNCVKFANSSGDLADAGATCSSIATGTSGHVVGFLDGNNTYSGTSTFSGAVTASAAGAASTAGFAVTGVPFAGTGTTSFPILYVNENTATASTTLNTAGTLIGGNGHGTVDLLNLLLDGTSKFKIDSGGLATAVFFQATSGYKNTASGVLMISSTSPSISSGFGTSPSIVRQNGTSAFTVNVGTGGTASSGVITMPAATNGWACQVSPNSTPQAGAVTYSAPTSTTSITLTNYTLSTAATLAWTASTVLQVTCIGY